MSRAASLARVAAAYAVAIAVAILWLVWGPDTGELWLDALIADVLATVVVFAASRLHHNSSFYDAYWSVAPPLLILYWWLEAGDAANDWRVLLLAVVVVVWAVRLTANWVITFPGLHHEDWRYPMVRGRAGRWELVADFFGIHLMPTLQVFLGCLPAYVAVTYGDRAFSWVDILACAIGLGAITLESAADRQMHQFIRVRKPGQAMDRGLWAWSRHPNYFAEITFWFALALFAVAAAPGEAWWLFVGALAMVGLFQVVSIPMMEAHSLERRPEYQSVIERVPRLVPRLPRRSSAQDVSSERQ